MNPSKNNFCYFGSIIFNTGIIKSYVRLNQVTLYFIEMAILKIIKQLWVMASSY